MQIYAKSKLSQNIYDKINKGAEGIEVHLDTDYEKSFKTINGHFVKDIPIKAIHSPFISTNCDSKLDTCVDHKSSWPVLEKTMCFAQKVAEKKGWNIIVIAHLSSNVEELKLYDIYDDIVNYLRETIEKFPNVELAIENATKRGGLNDNLVFRSICYDDTVTLVKDIHHERIGTCLDTCHAMMDVKMMKLMADFLGLDRVGYDNLVVIQKLRDYFEINKDVCKWIHLANIEEHGSGRDHGKPFKKKHKKKLRKIIDLYEEFGYTCPITIEVQEDDYSDAINFAKTKKTLESVFADKEKANLKAEEKAKRKEQQEIKEMLDDIGEALDSVTDTKDTNTKTKTEKDNQLEQHDLKKSEEQEKDLELGTEEKNPGHQILMIQDEKLRKVWNVDGLKESEEKQNNK